MVKKKNLLEGSPELLLDVFEAIKRSLIRRGLIRQKKVASSTDSRDDNSKKLSIAAIHSHQILFRATTVFPFTIFPDTVTVDREKLTLSERVFFFSAKITSVPIRDLLNVGADFGPFFGTVHTASRYFITTPLTIRFLWRSDAIKLQRLLQGYIIAHEQKIDCSNIEKDKLINLLNKLGKGDT